MNRTFEHFPEESSCPLCGTNRDEKCFLVPIDGTQEGKNIEAQPTHVKCITECLDSLRYNKQVRVIYIATI